jgi:hypothetical protein
MLLVFAAGLVVGVVCTLLLSKRELAQSWPADRAQVRTENARSEALEPPRSAAPSEARTLAAGSAPGRVDAQPDPLGILWGSVRGDRNQPIPDAEVSFCFARRSFGPNGEIGIEFRDSDAIPAKPDADGKFEATFREGGVVRVRAAAPGFNPIEQTKVLPPPPYRESLAFRLYPEEAAFTRIRGRILDLGREALAPEELHFLMPSVDDASESLEPFDTVSWIYAFSEGGGGSDDSRQSAAVHGERGTFEIRVRRGWRGTVTLLFRDRILQTRAWSDGDGEIEFLVDVAALRAGFGIVEVGVLDAETGARVPYAKVRVEREGILRGEATDRTFRQPERDPVRVTGVPPGRLTFRVSADGYAMATAVAEVAAGATTRVEILLRRPASLRVRLVPVEEGLDEPKAESVEYYDSDGTWVEFVSRLEREGNDPWIRLEGLPPGEGYLVASDNALRTRLSPGPNPDLELPVRRPRDLVVRYRLASAPPGEGAGPMGPGCRILVDGRVPIRDWSSTSRGMAEGWFEWSDRFPPGRYTLELGRPAGGGLRKEIDVGLDEETNIVVDG